MNRLKRFRFLKRDKEAVASTVGTIMALLVFLTFLSLFTNSYIPVWMQANERAHMNEVVNQFGDMKGRVDNMIVSARITGETAITMYSPITLGAQGVPIFASPTAGQLIYAPQGSANTGVSIKFNYTLEDDTIAVSETGGGLVQLWAPNRYYVQQWVAFENGGIVMKQPDGQVLRAFPTLTLEKIGDRVNVAFTQVDLIGSNATVGGTGAVGLNMRLVYLDSQSFTLDDDDDDLNITMRTQYADAWESYLAELCSKAGLVANSDYGVSTIEISDDVSIVRFWVRNAGTVDYDRAFVEVSVQV